MTDQAFSTQDHWIDTSRGRLFARSWHPSFGHSGRHLPPIILLHESLGCVALWRDFPERLMRATGRPIVAYDRLGFGRSDPHPDSLSEQFVLQEADEGFASVRRQLDLDRFVLFGHSIGGGMAIAAAAAFPARCEALITESAQAFVEKETLAGIRAAKALFAQPGQLDRLARYHGDKAAWVLSAWVDRWLTPAFETWNVHDALTSVECPLLALHGSEDEFGSFAQAERMQALAPVDVTIERLAGCGHVPHKTHSTLVLDTITRFLDRGRSSGVLNRGLS